VAAALPLSCRTVLSTALAADARIAFGLMPSLERARLKIGDERDGDARWTILGAEADLSVEPGRELEGREDTPSGLQVLLHAPTASSRVLSSIASAMS